FVVLLVAAIGLRPGIAALIAYTSKLPIDLRKSLHDFEPSRLTAYRSRPSDPNFTRLFSDQDLGTAEWLGLWVEERRPSVEPNGELMLFVTYYSDPRDSIPHTPEVCYRQGGATVHAIEKVSVETPGLGPDTPRIDARLLRINQGESRMAVLYVICCNGKYFHGRERARLQIGLPGDRYTYFSKIEVAVNCPEGVIDFDVAVERAKKLLAEALPVLVDEHFPTREQVVGD
ncbi:MAG: exosortase-associated EpsI family protein, partial [Planctomycetes bacterium]|nr:exosortase-associated EpsI family protein [Planctomycetota bacterium]